MTAPPRDDHPDNNQSGDDTPLVAARRAAHRAGLDSSGLTLLHQHATTIYLLPAANAVARVHSDNPAAATRAVTITTWLAEHGLPTTIPVPGTGPIVEGDRVITFWVHHPQPTPPPHPDPAHLGRLLRTLHQLPPPPLDLPTYRPLASLHDTIDIATCLTPDDRGWLTHTATELLHQYTALDFPLGSGHLHGDAYPGNMLYDTTTDTWLLSDWDETATGPRELDLANTYQGTRMGRTDTELDRFAAAYGHDLRHWPGLPTLRSIRDLHTLGSYIRRADNGDATAATELHHRLHVLQHSDPTTPWHPRPNSV